MNGDQSATKQGAELCTEWRHLHIDIAKRIDYLEARLLQAFYSFADTNNKRLIQDEAATAIVISRITTLEDRVLGLEKRLNIPPQ
jgi:hypothetical protein